MTAADVNAARSSVTRSGGESPGTPQLGWSARLWREAEEIFAAIVTHPFLTGLTDGTLDPAAFAHYVVQDAHYLRDYARALAAVGMRSSDPGVTAMFARHAAGVVVVEQALHATLLPALGIDPATVAATAAAPTTRAYTSYLLATALGGSFAEGLAAVLPCYWIYARVGERLLEKGSPDLRYQRWIDTYGGPEFSALVDEVLAVVDRTGPRLGADEESRARGHFTTAARYEWMFWDAALRRETWPL